MIWYSWCLVCVFVSFVVVRAAAPLRRGLFVAVEDDDDDDGGDGDGPAPQSAQGGTARIHMAPWRCGRK